MRTIHVSATLPHEAIFYSKTLQSSSYAQLVSQLIFKLQCVFHPSCGDLKFYIIEGVCSRESSCSTMEILRDQLNNQNDQFIILIIILEISRM